MLLERDFNEVKKAIAHRQFRIFTPKQPWQPARYFSAELAIERSQLPWLAIGNTGRFYYPYFVHIALSLSIRYSYSYSSALSLFILPPPRIKIWLHYDGRYE